MHGPCTCGRTLAGRTQKARRDRNTTVPASTNSSPSSPVLRILPSERVSDAPLPSSLFAGTPGRRAGKLTTSVPWYVPSVRRSYIGVLASQPRRRRRRVSKRVPVSARVDRVRCLARVREQHVRPAAAPVLPRCRLVQTAAGNGDHPLLASNRCRMLRCPRKAWRWSRYPRYTGPDICVVGGYRWHI